MNESVTEWIADQIAKERERLRATGVGQARQMGLVDAERLVRNLVIRPESTTP